jgi:hypothetical protein
VAVLVGLLLVVFCIGVALYPFLKARTVSARADASPSVQELVERRQAIYSDLEILDLDRGIGHVDEAEYQKRSREYRLAAAATFRDQERLEAADGMVEDAISRELMRWRSGHQDLASSVPCRACGKPLAVTDEQCLHCGQLVEIG